MRTGMTVVGRVTGRHPIRDLRADVPYNVAVTFTNEQVLRSRDLQVAIQQGFVQVLDGSVHASNHLPPPPDSMPPDDRVEALERQNRELREELAAEREEKRALRASLEALQGRMGDVLAAVERIGAGQVVQYVQGAPGAAQEPVGEPDPVFVPEVETVEGESQVAVKTSAGSTSVSGALDALKKLRSGEA